MGVQIELETQVMLYPVLTQWDSSGRAASAADGSFWHKNKVRSFFNLFLSRYIKMPFGQYYSHHFILFRS